MKGYEYGYGYQCILDRASSECGVVRDSGLEATLTSFVESRSNVRFTLKVSSDSDAEPLKYSYNPKKADRFNAKHVIATINSASHASLERGGEIILPHTEGRLNVFVDNVAAWT